MAMDLSKREKIYFGMLVFGCAVGLITAATFLTVQHNQSVRNPVELTRFDHVGEYPHVGLSVVVLDSDSPVWWKGDNNVPPYNEDNVDFIKGFDFAHGIGYVVPYDGKEDVPWSHFDAVTRIRTMNSSTMHMISKSIMGLSPDQHSPIKFTEGFVRIRPKQVERDYRVFASDAQCQAQKRWSKDESGVWIHTDDELCTRTDFFVVWASVPLPWSYNTTEDNIVTAPVGMPAPDRECSIFERCVEVDDDYNEMSSCEGTRPKFSGWVPCEDKLKDKSLDLSRFSISLVDPQHTHVGSGVREFFPQMSRSRTRVYPLHLLPTPAPTSASHMTDQTKRRTKATQAEGSADGMPYPNLDTPEPIILENVQPSWPTTPHFIIPFADEQAPKFDFPDLDVSGGAAADQIPEWLSRKFPEGTWLDAEKLIIHGKISGEPNVHISGSRVCEVNSLYSPSSQAGYCKGDEHIKLKAEIRSTQRWQSCSGGQGRCPSDLFPSRINVDAKVMSIVQTAPVTWVNVASQTWSFITASFTLVSFFFPTVVAMPMLFRFGNAYKSYKEWLASKAREAQVLPTPVAEPEPERGFV